jgi:4-carboxymuconolactone decarboxylase
MSTDRFDAARPDRMPPLEDSRMDPAQRAAAAELAAGPRKGVKGPFIALLRSPELLARLQRVGEYLRFASALPPRVSEFATLVVSRQWTQRFEWNVHLPLALEAGTSPQTVEALAEGRRPRDMDDAERVAYDFVHELWANRGVCDATYRETVEQFGERGLVDLVGLVGYFTTIAMVLNVAHTPAGASPHVEALPALPR